MAETVKKVRFIALMELRRRREDDCRRLVGQLERQRAELMAGREALAAERVAAAAFASDPAFHEVYATYWRRIEGELREREKRILQTEAEIAKARTELVEAHRETTVVGKLQDIDRREMTRAAERSERRRLDEFAGSRHIAASTAASTTEEAVP